MIDSTSSAASFSPPRLRRSGRPRGFAIVAALAGAVLAPGGAAAAGGAPALHARTVQERLVALGHLPVDAVSGRYDRRTLDAIARFQAEHGLPVDGVPDARTADELLNS